MTMRKELLDELLKDYKKPEDLIGENGILKELTKALIEKVLHGELTRHLGYDKHKKSDEKNSRNGTSLKRVKNKSGEISINVPRDRESTFSPQFISKHQRRFDGFDDKIISMYARGMSVRDIQDHLKEIYETEVSHDLISTVTDGVIKELRAWQTRPLEDIYPIVFFGRDFY